MILGDASDKYRIAGDNLYRYRPRINRIDTPFTDVADDAVGVVWTLLRLTDPALPLIILACAEGASRF